MGRPVDARALAYQVLLDVERHSAYLNVALANALASAGVADSRDTGLATEMAYGVYRRLLTLDAALQPVVDRPLSKLETAVLCLLRMGAYQLLYLDRIPPRAAVSETVRVAKENRLERAAGFINAVLRSLARNPNVPLPPESDLVAHLSVRESHPAWLVRAWLEQLGPAETDALCRANNAAPPVQVRCNVKRGSRSEAQELLTRDGVGSVETPHSPVGLTLEAPGRLEALQSFQAGAWQVQDEAAQCVGFLAGVGSGLRMLDACAAPGGKACHLLERAAPGSKVIAVDVHANKLRKIEEEASRLGLSADLEVRAADSTAPLPESNFDLALLDAPCTGLGTLRRHPELRYRRLPGDDQRLADLQLRLMRSVGAAIRPGGTMVYSVCTTSTREGALVVERFLEEATGFHRITPQVPDAIRPLLDERGQLTTWTHRHGMDGFFAAVLQRG